MANKIPAGDIGRKVLPLKKQIEIQEEWLEERLKTVMPQVMKRTAIDMWVVMTDEQNEDPITKTLLPASKMNARAKMILVYTLLPGGTVEAQSIALPSGIEGIYKNEWYGITSTDWKGKQVETPKTTALEFLLELVKRYDPQKIAINMDEDFPFCDGLSATNYKALTKALGSYAERLVPARELSIGWMETRTPAEMAAYSGIVQLAHDIIHEVFTYRYVTPGVTTVDELAMDFMQLMIDIGVRPSFDASCAVFRKGDPGMHNEGYTIMPGDILHCDIGIEYLGLCTDTQELAYICLPGETEAPKGLSNAVKITNRLQDIVRSSYKAGRTGNEVLKLSRQQAIAEGINPRVYSHPIGVMVHAPGPAVGLFSNQEHTKAGELTIYPSTAYSLELNATVDIPEWNQPMMTCLETDIMFDGKQTHFLAPRQENLILIK